MFSFCEDLGVREDTAKMECVRKSCFLLLFGDSGKEKKKSDLRGMNSFWKRMKDPKSCYFVCEGGKHTLPFCFIPQLLLLSRQLMDLMAQTFPRQSKKERLVEIRGGKHSKMH